MSRPIYEIAYDIQDHWPKVWYGAVPYLDAMYSLNDLSDWYYYDTADTIVRYFLANAQTWHGKHANRIRKELRALLK
jgi:hypothetical protein